MNVHDIIECLGKTEDTSEIKQLLEQLGITKPLKVPKGDNEARLSLTSLGLAIIFVPARPKTSQLVLDTVMFVSEHEDGYTSYTGALPEGLLFSDTQAEIHVKLGEPLISKPKFRLDIWEREQYGLTVEYAKTTPQLISVVSIDRQEQE